MRRSSSPGGRRPGPRLLGQLGVVAGATVAVAAVLALLATGVLGSKPLGPEQPTSSSSAVTTPPRTLTAEEASQAFLSGYVDPDGRVVRRDQGSDTVSEGQAYAMLIAVGIGDRDTFGRVWAWTQKLLRSDGTLSWRWQDGRVVDAESASDADVDAARALVLAGTRFGDPDLTAAGVSLGEAILRTETATTDLGLILTAGSWVTTKPYAYNPSYPSPAAFAVLHQATGDDRWTELAAGSRAATRTVLDATDLPPDWAQIHTDGSVDPMPGAAGRSDTGVRYSYDAARLPIRYAESCEPADIDQAVRLRVPLARFSGTPAVRDLGGRPLTGDASPVAIMAQAATEASAGEITVASDLLRSADRLQQQTPTYYGGAWDALGRLMLERNPLGGCGRLDA